MTNDDYNRYTVPIHAAATKPTSWRPAIDAHCLVAGGTNQERSTLIDSITADFSAAGWSVQRGDSVEKQREIITDTWVLMEQRYSQLMTGPTTREQFEPLLLVVDEEYGGIAHTATALSQIQDLLRLARSAKIHVLIGACSPHVELLSADMRDNLAVRIPVDAATRDHQLMRV